MSRSIIYRVFSILLLAGLFIGLVQSQAGQAFKSGALLNLEDSKDKIEALVIEEIEASGTTDFFVWMAEKADLSPADSLNTKLEKGQFVFNALYTTAERTQKDLRLFLDTAGVEYQAFYIANKILVRAGDQALLTVLSARSDVAEITANHKYQLDEPVDQRPASESVAAVEPNLTFINADDVWAMGITGVGTVMAGNDTGLDETHPAIAPHYRGCIDPPACTTWNHNYNWWDATDTYPSNPADGYGHGTHTTGTMVGDDYGGNQIGVAPGAQTIHCKNMTDGGSGDDATFTECFQWDLAPWDLSGANPNSALAPDAVNNSWGYWSGNSPQFKDEIQALHAAGILVEVSAGNEGSGCATLRSPGDYWEVLTTGSVNHADPFPGTITNFTSRGPSDIDGNYFPDIMAPGENVRSAVPGGSYEYWGGTSMAGPHATALIGLMWQACPSLRGLVYLTIDYIHDAAVPLTGQYGSNCGGDYTEGPNNDWGEGTIDALATVQLVMGACSGVGWLNGTVTDDATSLPIEGALVQADWEDGFSWLDASDAGGYYTMTVPGGTYTVTASAFGYLTELSTGITVETDTVTTLDFALVPATQYVISGTVTDAQSGQPLSATISVLDTPLDPVTTDPGTGFYSISIPEGTYTLRVTANVHQPQDRQVIVDHDQTQDFALDPLPCILLVDDDNDSPDTLPFYTAALDAMGYEYNVFDTGGGNGPDLAGLQGYTMVLWFSGDTFGGTAGPNSADETNLAAYLDGGGKLFLDSQDYLYDMGLTSFGQTYLGIASRVDDDGNATTKYGVAGDPVGDGLGPYALTYPSGFTDYGDIVYAGAGASTAFRSAAGGGGNPLDIDKDGGDWQTVFFGTSWVPIYNNNAANGMEALQSVIDFFGGCACEPVYDTSFTYEPLEPYAGLEVIFTGSASGTAPIAYEWDFGDGEIGSGQVVTHIFSMGGDYTVTLDTSNACGVDSFSEVVPVAYAPDIALTPDVFELTLAAGESESLALLVENYGGYMLSFDISEAPEADWLSIDPTSGDVLPAASLTATLSFDAGGLGAGVYTTTLQVTSNDPDEPQIDVPVTLTVLDLPDISLAPQVFTQTLTMGESTTADLLLGNSGDLTLTFVISETPAVDWLMVAPADGEILGGESLTATLSFDAGTLEVGEYNAVLNVTSNDPDEPWISVPVTLYVLDLPVEGLAAEKDSPTLLGEVTTLSATITGGTNVDFTWDFGDGEFGSGQVVTHTYAAVGVYTATVTASNQVGEMSAITLVTVYEEPTVYWTLLPLVFKDYIPVEPASAPIGMLVERQAKIAI